MTAQAYEFLRIGDVEYDMAACPLESWLDKFDKRPWEMVSTACYRGYVATWRIEERRLWLDRIAVEDWESKHYCLRPVPLPDGLFPGCSELPVPASWFTGQLRVPIGEEVFYVHHGFGAEHERLRLIRIENGHVRSDRTYDNLARMRRRIAGDAALAAHVAAQKRGDDALSELYKGRPRPMMWFTEVGLRLLDVEGG